MASAVNRQLVWRDRNGRQIGPAGPVGAYGSPSLSPDGNRLAFTRLHEGNRDIWIQDLTRESLSRLTFDPGFDAAPTWSAAGDYIAFSRLGAIARKPVGGGEPQRLGESTGFFFPSDWSGDGQFLLAGVASNDIVVVEMNGDHKPVALLTTPFVESHARFAPPPSGAPRWFAYDSDESGQPQVYVQAFTPGKPVSGVRSQISAQGGSEPRWQADGKQLFYLSADQRMMAVKVKTDGAALEAGRPVALFETSAQRTSIPGWSYDVTRDGQRFVLLEQPSDVDSQPITVVVNWQARLRK